MTDQAYVLQVVRDLLGHRPRGGRRKTPSLGPQDLPFGVAARLALVVAADRDAAVLTGALTRGSEEDQRARLQLVAQSVAAAPHVDVRAPVSLPVRCGRRIHPVALAEDGELSAPSHPGVDVVAERVAASFGGTLLPCLEQMDQATASWPPPAADDGPRAVPIQAGELLAFVRTARTWVERGHSLPQASYALQHGVSEQQLAGHLALGLDVRTAVEWRAVRPADAVRWLALGFSLDDRQEWQQQGRDLRQAETATALVGDGPRVARWARAVGGQVPESALVEWALFGLPVGMWGEVASRGIRAAEASEWTRAGFGSVEILRYAHLRVPIEDATAWRDAGFSAFDASGYLGVGMGLEEAVAVKDLPARAAQAAWKEWGSVDGVRLVVEPLPPEEPGPVSRSRSSGSRTGAGRR
jgi:hypothetical protein